MSLCLSFRANSKLFRPLLGRYSESLASHTTRQKNRTLFCKKNYVYLKKTMSTSQTSKSHDNGTAHREQQWQASWHNIINLLWYLLDVWSHTASEAEDPRQDRNRAGQEKRRNAQLIFNQQPSFVESGSEVFMCEWQRDCNPKALMPKNTSSLQRNCSPTN